MDKKDRRYIEESFPVKEVSAESVREKNIRHGHISTLHIWWARRPFASSRATEESPKNTFCHDWGGIGLTAKYICDRTVFFYYDWHEQQVTWA